MVESGNVKYYYTGETLDQIIFKENGIALVPRLRREPVGIFLSEEVKMLKNFIRTHSSYQ